MLCYAMLYYTTILYSTLHYTTRPRLLGLFSGPEVGKLKWVHTVSITRFPSFRTQPLESLSVDSVNKWIPEQPRPWRKS